MMGHASATLAAAATTPALLRDLLIVLATAGLVAMVTQRLRLAATPGYLLAGAMIGPFALGWIQSADQLESLSRLAIILLLFGIGMHLHFSALRTALGRYVAAGIGSGLATTALGWPIAMAMGLSAPAALAVAMALSLSSTAVVLQMLSKRRELQRTHGRMCFAILVIQDIAVLGILALIPLLADWAQTGASTDPSEQATFALLPFLGEAALRLGALAGMLVLAQWLLPRLLHEAARGGSSEVLLVISTAAAIGAAAAAQAIGFSAELGAFLAGVMLSSTPFRYQLSAQIGPLRDVFIAVFFTIVGMSVDPAALVDWWWLILVGAVVMLAVKAVVIGLSCWAVGTSAAVAVLVGLLLAQGGEFSLLVLFAAQQQNLLSDRAVAVVVAVVVTALIVTPSLANLARFLSSRTQPVALPPWLKGPIRTADEIDPEAEAGRRHAVIGGFGPVGQAVAEALENAGVSYTVIELNPQTVRRINAQGKSAVYGDVSNAEVLESAGLHHADVLVLTIPDEDATLQAIKSAQTLAPDVFIAVRTNLASRSHLATALGADHVITDELTTAEGMRRVIMEHLAAKEGQPTEEASQP